MEKENNDTHEFEDSFIVAAIQTFDPQKNLRIIPFKKPSGKVAWKVQGDISPMMESIYKNQPVPINDFINILKSVRSMIFTFRAGNNETSKGGDTRA